MNTALSVCTLIGSYERLLVLSDLYSALHKVVYLVRLRDLSIRLGPAQSPRYSCKIHYRGYDVIHGELIDKGVNVIDDVVNRCTGE